MSKRYIEYMTAKPPELMTYIQEWPIAYVPFGALEWHGEHMVLGVDSIKATFLCEKSAEITGGVLFPCVNWGAFGTMNFPFTPNFSKGSLTRLTRKMMDYLYKMGFRIVILLTGHYPTGQITNVRKAAQAFTQKYSDGFALGVPEHALATNLDYYGEHAAEWETSIMMAINPLFVDLAQIPSDLLFSERCARHGILGRDPTVHASVEKGQNAINVIVTRLSKAVEEVKATHSAEPFERIYEEFKQAQKHFYNIRHPLNFDGLFKFHGMENRHELWNFIKWQYLRKGKYTPNYKSYKD